MGSPLSAIASLRSLFPYFRRYRGGLAWGAATVLITVGVSLAGPQVLRHGIDDITVAITRQKLAFYAGLVVVVAAVEGLFRFLMRRVLIGISRDIEYDLRNDVFEKLLKLPRAFFDAHPTGDIMNRCSSDINSVRMLLGPGIMYSITTVTMFTLAVVLMVRIDAGLTVLALLPLPLSTVVVYFFSRRIHESYKKVQEYFGDVSVFLQETFAGIRLLRAYGAGEARERHFGQMMGRYVELNRGLISAWGLFFPFMGMLGGLGGVVVLYYGGSQVIAGRISLGSFVAFSIYVVMLAWPMMSAGWVLNVIQRGATSMERLNLILEATGVEGADWDGNVIGPPPRIEMRDLTFSYPESPARRALASMSLTIPAGAFVGVVGKVGSGKSTLASLLTGLYTAPRGTLFIDGRDIKDISHAELRRLITIVPQDPFLFSETIAQNVQMGGDGDIGRYTSMAGLDTDLAAFPHGLETLVGERGITLSGGQKQRVTIARALARRAPVIIFDDSLSSVDVETEAEILRSIATLPGAHTLIVISHRISSIRGADMIVTMKDGAVAEVGVHSELMERGGLYASLFRREELEAELAEM